MVSLQRLTDPASPAFGVLSVAGMTALTLLDPAPLSDQGRRRLRALTAAANGLYVYATAVDLPPEVPRPVIGVLATGASWALTGPSWRLDARTVSWLTRHGVRHPRRWMAATTGLATLGMYLGDRAAARERYLAATDADAAGSADAAEHAADPGGSRP